MFTNATKILTRCAVSGLAVLMASMPSYAADWKPIKPVEMVIMAGQGGGADRLARLFQSIIQKENLASMPILPINKGGGSGAEAMRYLKDKSGDPHVLMATLNSYYTTPLRTDIGVDIEEFTPIARMENGGYRHRSGRQPYHGHVGKGIWYQAYLCTVQRWWHRCQKPCWWSYRQHRK